MSDERKLKEKELPGWIDEFWYAFRYYHPKRSLFKKGMAEQAYKQIRHSLIQQRPEIDEKYVSTKAEEMLTITYRITQTEPYLENHKINLITIKDFFNIVVNDIQGNQEININKDWLPTAKNINALPMPVRDYIASLETNADPPGMIQENALLRDTCEQLEAKLARQKPEIDDMEEYVGEKVQELLDKTSDKDFSYTIRWGFAVDIITQIISDVKGGKHEKPKG